MAANSHDEEFLENTHPAAPGSFNLKDINATESDEDIEEIPIEDEEKNRQSLLELKQRKEWLLQQKISHESELLARRLQQHEDLQTSLNNSSQSDLYDRISKLQDQLYSLSTARSYKKLVLKRLLSGDQLIKKLFPDVVSESPTEKQIEEMNSFAKLCEKQNKLSSEILVENEALLEVQTSLDKIKQLSYDQKKKNRGLMQTLQKLKEERKNAEEGAPDNRANEKRKMEIADTVEKINVVRNVFQGIIVGSGIDWALDDEMRKLVLSLGETLEFAA
ncbi:centromere protein H-like isoform X1 [Montipora foliosa]|uniref:centromere protein H-like isoform X1 n=2 Tax=Montipora foliosa TaxID=591990 RepID=UPI0035F16657